MELNFQPDADDPKSTVLVKTENLLREPITRVSPFLKPKPDAINAAAGGLCRSIQPLLSKYPFNSGSKVDASLDEVNAFLKPNDGQLSQLYNTTLKQLLTPSGSEYLRATGAPFAVTEGFLQFFNRAAHLSQALYNNNAPQPTLSFTMQAIPAPDVNHISLQINGQTLSSDLKAGANSQVFTWPGTSPSAALDVKFGDTEFNISHSTGLWAIWHLLDEASERTTEREPDVCAMDSENLCRTDPDQRSSGNCEVCARFTKLPDLQTRLFQRNVMRQQSSSIALSPDLSILGDDDGKLFL